MLFCWETLKKTTKPIKKYIYFLDSYIQWLSDIQFVGHLAAEYGRIHWEREMTTTEMEFFCLAV